MLGWQAIRDEALRRIHAREWAPGEMIPNEADLAQEFGCARTTVNRALRDLADAGFLDRRRKAGTRVALTPLRKATLEIPVISQEIEARGGTYGYALVSRRLGAAPIAVQNRLGLPAGARLLHVCALHLCDGVPYVYEDRWVNPVTVPGILQIDLGRINANAWLVQNVPYSRGELALSAAAADDAVASSLQCPASTAVFAMERITWMGEAPITLVTQYHAPGYRLTTSI
ncbi:MAG: UTRA domain-containing protein [Pararhodobacter sp.]|nr:UTRA domain-containing protein [Pararhodobacter sp.]